MEVVREEEEDVQLTFEGLPVARTKVKLPGTKPIDAVFQGEALELRDGDKVTVQVTAVVEYASIGAKYDNRGMAKEPRRRVHPVKPLPGARIIGVERKTHDDLYGARREADLESALD
jgi:hypothetical protein